MGNKYHEINDLLWRNARVRRRVIEGRTRSLGIHPSQHIVLMKLNEGARVPSQNQIAQQLDVSAATVARTLNCLEAGGYIRRQDGQKDGRCNEIEITRQGRDIVAESLVIFDGLDAQIYAGFDDAELDCFAHMLTRIRENLVRQERANARSVHSLQQAVKEDHEFETLV